MHPFALPVAQLHRLEMGAGTLQVRGVEGLSHLFQGQYAVARGGVTQSEQMITYRGARIACVTQLTHAGGAMALGQRRAVRADQQRDVAILRYRQCQRLEQQALPRRIGQMILTPQHMADLHQRIVHGIAEQERRAAILPSDDEIADVIGSEALRTMGDILELETAARRDPKTQAGGQSTGRPRCTLLPRQFATAARVAWRASRSQLRTPRQLQLQGRTEARISQQVALELLEVALVQRPPLGLAIRRAGAATIGSLVPAQAEPAQIGAQRLH